MLLLAAAFVACFFAASLPARPAQAVSFTFTVTTALDENGACDESCSLREAITAANANPDADTINFNLVPAAPWVLTPGSQLPAITDGLTIDGFCAGCESSANTAATSQAIDAVYGVVLNGSLAGAGATGLIISTTEPVTIRGLVINGWTTAGIRVNADGNHVIAGNFIGTNVSGTIATANNIGISILESDGLTIGGPNPADRNVISGNSTYGINACDSDADNITIRGNFIGPAASGTAALINGTDGISLCQGTGVTIGGSLAAGHTNVISGNLLHGINATGSTDLDIQGNRIGTIRGGTLALPNGGSGVRIINSNMVSIGGVASGNTISGNFGNGVTVENTDNLTVRANTIGIAASGGTALPNGVNGVFIDTGANIEIRSNYIGNNLSDGIEFQGEVTDVTITSNFIGTTFTGIASGNDANGILLDGDLSSNVTIGGSGGGNIIVYNGGMGILVSDGVHTNMTITSNDIGIDGLTPAGNTYAGIMITFDAGGTFTIGAEGGGNDIRNNGDDGIMVTAPDAIVTMRYNGIFENGVDAGDIPIDLGMTGDTANDAGDVDTGPNNLQNYPLFDRHYSNYLKLSLETTPFGTFTFDLYEAVCINGRAQPISHVGASTVPGSPSGMLEAEFISPIDLVTPGAFVTATATDADGRTSEVNPTCTEAIPAVLIADLGGLDFYPGNRTIPRGTELAFVNRHTDAHQATSDDGVVPPFTTGLLATRTETTILFDTAGVFTYSSDTHPGLTGTITVTGTNPDPDITSVDETNLFALVDSAVLISGTGFISGSVVEFDGVELEWAFSGSDILADVPAGLVPALGSATVRVTNPAPVDPDGFDEFEVAIHRSPADVDCDLDVDAVDALAVLRMLAGFTDGVLLQVCAIEPIDAAGDANQDASEDILDLLFIRSVVAGIH